MLEQTDAAQCGSNGAGDEQTDSKYNLCKPVRERNGVVEKRFDTENAEDAVQDGNIARYAREPLDEECDVGSETRRVIGVEKRAREVLDCGLGR
jgi:hypothetical protein